MWKVSQGSALAVSAKSLVTAGSRDKWIARRRSGWTIWKHLGTSSVPCVTTQEPWRTILPHHHTNTTVCDGKTTCSLQTRKAMVQCPEVNVRLTQHGVDYSHSDSASWRHQRDVLNEPFVRFCIVSYLRANSESDLLWEYRQQQGTGTVALCPLTKRRTSTDGHVYC